MPTLSTVHVKSAPVLAQATSNITRDVAVLVLVLVLLRERKPAVPDSPAGLDEEIAATAASE